MSRMGSRRSNAIYLDGSLDFIQAITHRIWLVNHLKDCIAYGGLMKKIVNRHIAVV